MIVKTHIRKQLSSIILTSLTDCAVPLNKWRRNFILETLLLFLSIPGRINFQQLGRYSDHCEQRFRQQFENDFDFMKFNIHLVNETFTSSKAIAIDPSYLPKSGKKTPYIGNFWSGCAGSVKRGIEVMGIAVIDIDTRQSLHLEAIQTPSTKELPESCNSLLTWYLKVIKDNAESLLKVSTVIVADAFFSKFPFVDGVVECGFHLTSRLYKNAALRYLYEGEKSSGKGRPKQYDGKINLTDLDLSRFCELDYNGNSCYYAKVNSIALKRNILIIVERIIKGDKTIQRVIFSTDIKANPKDVLDTYHTRFQIEFLFRDAKQSIGLTHCQARSKNKIHSHVNFALTALNIAKIAHWRNTKNRCTPFSISDIKLLMNNHLMMELIFRKFGINPNSKKNHKVVNEIIIYGSKIA